MKLTSIVFVAAAVVCSANAGAIGNIGYPGIVATNVYARPSYTSSYAVSDKITGDQKSATETRDGDVTKGSYSVVQPDGVLRTVNYLVTPFGGFQAQVLNNGISVNKAVVGPVVSPAIISGPSYGYAAGIPSLATNQIVNANAFGGAVLYNNVGSLGPIGLGPIGLGQLGLGGNYLG